MYLNKATIIGNLTCDPELKSLPNGTAVCNFSIATNRVWKDKSGTKQKNVEYHNIVIFGAMGENVAKCMKKGSSLLVEGRIKTQSWEKEGQKHHRTEIIAENVQFGSSPKTENSAPKPKKEDVIEYPEDEVDPNNIPF